MKKREPTRIRPNVRAALVACAVGLLPFAARAQIITPGATQVQINENGEVFKVVGNELIRIEGAVGRLLDSNCALPFEGVVQSTGSGHFVAFGTSPDCGTVDARVDLFDDLLGSFTEVFVRNTGAATPIAPAGAPSPSVLVGGVLVTPALVFEAAASPLFFVDPAPECTEFLRGDGIPVVKPEADDPVLRAAQGPALRMPPDDATADRLYGGLDAALRDGLMRGLTMDEALDAAIAARRGN